MSTDAPPLLTREAEDLKAKLEEARTEIADMQRLIDRGFLHCLPMGADLTTCGLHFLPKEVKSSTPGAQPYTGPAASMPINDAWQRSSRVRDPFTYGSNRVFVACPNCWH